MTYDDHRPSQEAMRMTCRQCGRIFQATTVAIQLIQIVPPCDSCGHGDWVDDLGMSVSFGCEDQSPWAG